MKSIKKQVHVSLDKATDRVWALTYDHLRAEVRQHASEKIWDVIEWPIRQRIHRRIDNPNSPDEW